MSTPDQSDAHFYFRKERAPHDRILDLREAPPWRRLEGSAPDFIEGEPSPDADILRKRRTERGEGYLIERTREIELINAAIYLRRPLLVSGTPGVGKSTLAYAIAHQLQLSEVLVWPITSRSTLQDGLYQYDAIGRLQEESRLAKENVGTQTPTRIEDFIRLGPLGTALLGQEPFKIGGSAEWLPRVLLIDEIDKSDVDFPNELLNVLEEGRFEIRELSRVRAGGVDGVHVRTADTEMDRSVTVVDGKVRAREFPIVILTSNDEREFPPAFLRRCLQLPLPAPSRDTLLEILKLRLEKTELSRAVETLVDKFLENQPRNPGVSTDQLMNMAQLLLNGLDSDQLRSDVIGLPIADKK